MKRLIIALSSIIVAVSLLFTYSWFFHVSVTTAKSIISIGVTRTKTPTAPIPYYIGGGKNTLDNVVWSPHYTDSQGVEHNINNEIVNGAMTQAPYSFRLLQSTFNAGRIAEFAVNGKTIQLQPMPLQWTNDLDQISQIVIPQTVPGVVTNTPIELEPGVVTQQGSIEWIGAYGTGINFKWTTMPTRLAKVLTINSPLASPPANIISGGNPAFRFSLVFDVSTGVDIYVDNVLWTRGANTKIQTFGSIEYRDTTTGTVLWQIAPMLYWDANGQQGESIKTVRRVGSSLYIDITVPHSWLQTATYPVFVDADVQIDSSVSSTMDYMAKRGGPFWTSTTVGYIVYVESDEDLAYQKTSNGGTTWGGAVDFKSGTVVAYDAFADWQVAGDSGTKIHVMYLDSATNDIRYIYLDTSTDTVGGDDQILAGDGGVLSSLGQSVSITKTRGGNIAAAYCYYNDSSSGKSGFSTSPDADTWTAETTLFESTAYDYIQLYPGNEADNQDVWAAFVDTSADAISLKVYDDSGNSWAETAIATMVETATVSNFDGQIRLSDGHLILAFWNAYDTAAADLLVYDINGSGSITAKTNIITDESESASVSVLINHVNDDIYVAYCSGSSWTATVKVFYQKSDDGGGTWGGETSMQEDSEDDERWISAGCMNASWGGKFQPVWQNDDLNDLYTNTNNGVTLSTGGTVAIEVTPTTYDFGVIAMSSVTNTTTTYFTLDNNSDIQTDQTISVTTNTWSGGVGWTHSDTATAGANTAGLKAQKGGTWGASPVIVKYSSPNYIAENQAASTNYSFGLSLIAPTSVTDGVQKQIVVRVTAASG